MLTHCGPHTLGELSGFLEKDRQIERLSKRVTFCAWKVVIVTSIGGSPPRQKIWSTPTHLSMRKHDKFPSVGRATKRSTDCFGCVVQKCSLGNSSGICRVTCLPWCYFEPIVKWSIEQQLGE